MTNRSEVAYFYPQGHEAHARKGHPESPQRVEAIVEGLREAGYLERFTSLPAVYVPTELLENVHRSAYLNLLEMACKRGDGMLDADTYVTAASWELALQSVGGGLAVVRAVWQGEQRRGLALTRPPGHHARRGQGMGFCLLNNIAIAAEDLLQHGARRLAIVDLDLHHGNGTQEIFWERPEVFYLSTHQQPLFPGSGDLDETGAGRGAGFTANFPLPPMSGDQAFLHVMDELILPLLTRYHPDMLLVSYGFDTHWRDSLGSLLLSADGYARLISRLVEFADQHCQGRIAVFLEGGYDLEAGKACTNGLVAALLGEVWDDPLGPALFPEGTSWQKMIQNAVEYWAC